MLRRSGAGNAGIGGRGGWHSWRTDIDALAPGLAVPVFGGSDQLYHSTG